MSGKLLKKKKRKEKKRRLQEKKKKRKEEKTSEKREAFWADSRILFDFSFCLFVCFIAMTSQTFLSGLARLLVAPPPQKRRVLHQ